MSVRISSRSTARNKNNENKPIVPSSHQQPKEDIEEEISENEKEESKSVKEHGYRDESPTSEDDAQLKIDNNNNSNNNNKNDNDSDENILEEQNRKNKHDNGLTNGYSDHHKKQNNQSDIEDEELRESLSFLNKIPKDIPKITESGFLGNLMNQYLGGNKSNSRPLSPNPRIRKTSTDAEKLDELEKNLKALRSPNKKHLPPPVRSKPRTSSKTWDDPKEHQRPKTKEKAWPPREEPKDLGAYVVESYGQTDPYSKKLIKDIQKQKRQEEELREAQKRSEIIKDSVKPVSHLKSTFDSKPPRPIPGSQRPESNIHEERSWIKHEKQPIEFDKPPDEPDWMKLIRNRRWKSTVKARFPCQANDRTDFERRSTTPKNWKRLAKDKQALKVLSEIVGIGAEGEELFSRLASQRQKIEEEQEVLDKLAEEDLLAYEVARESLGEDAAYQLQMDNPLPAARMKKIPSSSSMKEIPTQEKLDALSTASGQYPFTTSQLEAAYITNQLLRLHPEEFRKLMSLERSRQATLRWQFSSDPFDSVHDHQSLPYEIALLASEEPRVQQAMKKILSQAPSEDFRSVFSGQSTPRGSRARSVSGSRLGSNYGSSLHDMDSDLEGYESGNSVSSGGSTLRGRQGSQRKKKPIPLPKDKNRNRSVSPSMLARRKSSGDNLVNGPLRTLPPQQNRSAAMKQLEDDREVHSHGLLSDQELQLSEEIAKLQELTSNIDGNIDEELREIEASISEDNREYLREILNKQKYITTDKPKESIDLEEIAQRRRQFLHKEKESQDESNTQDALPKKRHKVRRIQSATQLDAVLGGRRQMSESNLKGEDDDDASETDTAEEKPSDDMKNLLNDINSRYGNDD